MGIEYYDFNTVLGKMIIFFSNRGLVYLNLLDGNEEDVVKFANGKYGQTRKIDGLNYDYHKQIIEYLDGRLKEFFYP